MENLLQRYQKYQESWASWYRYTLGTHIMMAQHQLDGDSVDILDAASGNGLMSEFLLERGHTVTLYDIAHEMIEEAQSRLAEPYKERVSFYEVNLNKALPDLGKQFDLVLMHHIIEYLDDPCETFRRLGVQATAVCEMSLITLNPVSEVLRRIHFDKSPQKAYANLTDLSYDARWFGKAQMYNDEELMAMLDDSGWDVIDKRGMRIFSDYTNESLSDDPNFRSAMIRLEMETSTQEPYHSIGRYRQWKCRRKQPGA
jgi:2-polyprenyl-3-methyl-5-hydroxy-6-metoxy-1,4-benzoquinol methylase